MSVALLTALLVGVFVINLTIVWTILRGDVDFSDVFDAGRSVTGESDAADLEAVKDDGSSRDAEPPPLSDTAQSVICRHCGAANRPGYRYCRWCVHSGFADDGRQSDDDTAMARRPL